MIKNWLTSFLSLYNYGGIYIQLGGNINFQSILISFLLDFLDIIIAKKNFFLISKYPSLDIGLIFSYLLKHFFLSMIYYTNYKKGKRW